MARIGKREIPEELEEGLVRLLTLDDEKIGKLEEALEAATPALYGSRLASYVAQKAQLSTDDTVKIISALLILNSGHRLASGHRLPKGIPLSRLIEDLFKALQAQDKDNPDPPDRNWETLKDRLTRLLRFEKVLDITSKGLCCMNRGK